MYCYSYDNVKRIMQTEKGKQLVEQAKALYNEKFAGEPIIKRCLLRAETVICMKRYTFYAVSV